MKNFLISLLDWIYKKKCYFCSDSKESVKMCSKCYEELEFLPVEVNRKFCGVNFYCAGVYENLLQKMIRGLKYHNQRELAHYQAKFMYEYWCKILNKSEFYQVVPVPLYKKREKSRKYNHMELVAEEFCNLSGYGLNTKLIERVKDTRPQYKLNKSQRMDNLSGAFKINKNALAKGNILILDDICTTGATFENIILELQKNGVDNIVCFATTTPIG
jgi:ComF family protein